MRGASTTEPFDWQVSIPPNTSAIVQIPARRAEDVTESDVPVAQATGHQVVGTATADGSHARCGRCPACRIGTLQIPRETAAVASLRFLPTSFSPHRLARSRRRALSGVFNWRTLDEVPRLRLRAKRFGLDDSGSTIAGSTRIPCQQQRAARTAGVSDVAVADGNQRSGAGHGLAAEINQPHAM